MDEPEDFLRKTFVLTPEQLDFLSQINENTSLSLRTVLDSIKNGEEQVKRKQNLDMLIIFMSFGMICWFLGYVIDSLVITSLAMLLGTFLFAYGTIGGVMNALQRRRINRK